MTDLDPQADLQADPLTWLHAQPLRARVSPARWHSLQALAQRAAAQPTDSPLRAALLLRLDARLQALASAPLAPPHGVHAPATSPWAALRMPGASPADDATWPPLKASQWEASHWTALRMQRRLGDIAQAQAQTQNAQALGPLNAQALVPRALALLGQLSPAYLQRLLTQLDALEALKPAGAGASDTRPGKRR